MGKKEFYKEYRQLHFERFRFFPDPPEIEFEWSLYIDERDGALYVRRTPPQEYYGKNWWKLSLEVREEELASFDPDFEFDEKDFGRWYLMNMKTKDFVGRWKDLKEYDPKFPANGFSDN